jgi:REP element-mobilizing transposase RayT
MPAIIKPEFPNDVVFITTRTSLSKLWFKLGPSLNDFVYAALARYQEMYKAEIFAFVLQGNHFHLLARFPHCNRASFMRDFNSIMARSLPHLVPEFEGGKLWARSYRMQIVPTNKDIRHWFLYTVLNPVSSGITINPTALGRPNALSIIRDGGSLTCKWFNRSKYNNAVRKNPNVDKERYYSYHTLTISKIPGYKSLSWKHYICAVNRLAAKRTKEIVKERQEQKKGFLGEKRLQRQKAGEKPLFTKKSDRHDPFPLVLSLCSKTKQERTKSYRETCNHYRTASIAYREGKPASFPPNTYLPCRFKAKK